MSAKCSTALALLALIPLRLLAEPLGRDDCERQFAPKIGIAGKDVIWVPTSDALVKAMLEAAQVKADDYLIDLGSGDGKIPIAAARDFGARALGIEYNPDMVRLAQCYVAAEKLTERVEIRTADIFETDFSAATVLTLYLLTDLNVRLRPTILRMKPGTRVVSNRFRMGDWTPDQFVDVGAGSQRGYLWIVPARVSGSWTFRERGGTDSFRVRLRQRYQEVEGTVLGSARSASVRNAVLRGAELRFTLLGHGQRPLELHGTVAEDSMELATADAGRPVEYVGTREGA